MVQKKEEGVSLKPSDAIEGGGLLDNVDVVWKEIEFTSWDYAGTRSEEVTAFRVLMGIEGQDDTEQYWSCGGQVIPSKDGRKLTGGTLSKSSNFIILMNSLQDAGFPEDKIGDDCSVFEGLECHMVRIPAPKRGAGIPSKTTRSDGREFDKTVLVVDSIIKLPWEKAGKGAAKGKKDEAGDDEVTEKATEITMTILGKNPKGIEKKKLAGTAFTELKKEGMKMTEINAVTRLLMQDDFYENKPFSLNDGIVSM